LREFDVPASVLAIGDRCFENCSRLVRIGFARFSRLNRIGENVCSGCGIHSIAIPASVEEIDGSAFAKCPILEIAIAAGNRRFRVQGNLVVRNGGKEVVRYFGMEREVVVAREIEILLKSSFESCTYVQNIVFENGSKLRTIGNSAFADCKSLVSLSIPRSVEIIGDASFNGCTGLEFFEMNESVNPVMIGNERFSECRCLRSFEVESGIERTGGKCFEKCCSLHMLTFQSPESLRKVLGDLTVDQALEHLGLTQISTVFKIDLGPGPVELVFPGSVSVVDESSHLTLIRDTRSINCESKQYQDLKSMINHIRSRYQLFTLFIVLLILVSVATVTGTNPHMYNIASEAACSLIQKIAADKHGLEVEEDLVKDQRGQRAIGQHSGTESGGDERWRVKMSSDQQQV
jgi:hypothetical protein